MILINASTKNALKIFQPFLPIFAPVGLGYIYATLSKEEIPAILLDQQIEDDIWACIDSAIDPQQKRPVFGISVLTAAYDASLNLSKEIKQKYPNSVIVFGGSHPSAVPEEVLSNPEVDIVVIGEGERVMAPLYKAIQNDLPLSSIPGIMYRDDDKLVRTSVPEMIIDLDSLPPFPYELFSKKEYDMGFIVSSRGCPYNCIFCSNRTTTGKRYRHHSTSYVIDTIKRLHDDFHQRHILFLDDNLLVNHKRIEELLTAIKSNGFHNDMTFSCQARGDNVNPSILAKMREAGFNSIFFGLETGDEEVMQLIDKGETVECCANAVRMAKQAGFHTSATFIYALPNETHKERIKSLSLCLSLPLDMVRFNNATPYPGTRLYEMAKQENRLNVIGNYTNFCSVSTFIEPPFSPTPFSYVPENNSEGEIRNDILLSYLMFYLNPRRIFRIITTPKEGVGWFDGGSSISESLRKIPALILLAIQMLLKFTFMFCHLIFNKNILSRISEIFHLMIGASSEKDDRQSPDVE